MAYNELVREIENSFANESLNTSFIDVYKSTCNKVHQMESVVALESFLTAVSLKQETTVESLKNIKEAMEACKSGHMDQITATNIMGTNGREIVSSLKQFKIRASDDETTDFAMEEVDMMLKACDYTHQLIADEIDVATEAYASGLSREMTNMGDRKIADEMLRSAKREHKAGNSAKAIELANRAKRKFEACLTKVQDRAEFADEKRTASKGTELKVSATVKVAIHGMDKAVEFYQKRIYKCDQFVQRVNNKDGSADVKSFAKNAKQGIYSRHDIPVSHGPK